MNPTQRPRLTNRLSASEFAAWYWLKEEMVAFCRLHRLGTAGSKPELHDRIVSHLSGIPVAKQQAARRRPGPMPNTFTLETVIGPGWRCNPALGAFLREVCGSGFHFNAAMRDFIHTGSGQTLADAAICYHASMRPGQQKRSIAPQLEYNQHFRKYFAEHPGATREEAIAAWWALRGSRKSSAD